MPHDHRLGHEGNGIEERVRGLLGRMAEEVPHRAVVTEQVRKGVLLRVARTVGLAALAVALIAFGTVATVRALRGSGRAVPAAACGPRMIAVAAPAASGGLAAIAAISSSDVWAVGPFEGSEPGTRAIAMHWDGEGWTVAPPQHPASRPFDAEQLVAVSAATSNDVWAVGSWTVNATATGGGPARVLIEHWDGSGWFLREGISPGVHESRLSSVAAIASDDVWAVGFYGAGAIAKPLIEHWDGVRWSVVPSPEVTGRGSGAVLNAVSGVASDDVWAVGDGPHGTLIEHWDGVRWSVVPSPTPSHDELTVLAGVSAAGTDDVWAAGSALGKATWPLSGSSGAPTSGAASPLGGSPGGGVSQPVARPVFLRWDGVRWSEVEGPEQGARDVVIPWAIATSTRGDAWAVGTRYLPDAHRYAALAMHWNGAEWQTVEPPAPPPGAGNEILRSATALPDGSLWTAGEARDTVIPGEGTTKPLIEHATCAP